MAMKTLAKVLDWEESLRGLAKSGVSSRGKGGTFRTSEDELASLSNPMATATMYLLQFLLILLLFKVCVREIGSWGLRIWVPSFQIWGILKFQTLKLRDCNCTCLANKKWVFFFVFC